MKSNGGQLSRKKPQVAKMPIKIKMRLNSQSVSPLENWSLTPNKIIEICFMIFQFSLLEPC